jgi:hypothetical protein
MLPKTAVLEQENHRVCISYNPTAGIIVSDTAKEFISRHVRLPLSSDPRRDVPVILAVFVSSRD